LFLPFPDVPGTIAARCATAELCSNPERRSLRRSPKLSRGAPSQQSTRAALDRVDPLEHPSVRLIFSPPSTHRPLHVGQKVHTSWSGRKGLRDVDATTQANSKPLSARQGAAFGRNSLRGVRHSSTKTAGEVPVPIQNGNASSAPSTRAEEPGTCASAVTRRPGRSDA